MVLAADGMSGGTAMLTINLTVDAAGYISSRDVY